MSQTAIQPPRPSLRQRKGAFVRQVRLATARAMDSSTRPSGVAVDSAGNVYVADYGQRPRPSVQQPQGVPLFASSARYGSGRWAVLGFPNWRGSWTARATSMSQTVTTAASKSSTPQGALVRRFGLLMALDDGQLQRPLWRGVGQRGQHLCRRLFQRTNPSVRQPRRVCSPVWLLWLWRWTVQGSQRRGGGQRGQPLCRGHGQQPCPSVPRDADGNDEQGCCCGACGWFLHVHGQRGCDGDRQLHVPSARNRAAWCPTPPS
jgi:hypothetical protein